MHCVVVVAVIVVVGAVNCVGGEVVAFIINKYSETGHFHGMSGGGKKSYICPRVFFHV